LEKQEFHQIEKIGLSLNLITWAKKKISAVNLRATTTFIENPGL
jgi:hypothetical protein